MRFLSFFLLVMILVACSKPDQQQQILVFGHAGMGLSMDNSIYHDNSLEAISLALHLPTSNGVEVDVRLSADGTLWLYHDEWLEAESNGVGCVSELSDEQLSKLTYRSNKKEKLAKLSDALALLQEDQVLFLDLKQVNSCRNERIDFEQLMESFESQIESHKNQVKIICSYEFWINQLANEYEVYYSTDDVIEGKEILQKHPKIKGLVVRNAAIASNDIAWIKQQGKSIFLYDIRSLKGIKKAFRKNPTGIFSDDLRNALTERNYAL